MDAASILIGHARKIRPLLLALTRKHRSIDADDLLQHAAIKWWAKFQRNGAMPDANFLYVRGRFHFLDLLDKNRQLSKLPDVESICGHEENPSLNLENLEALTEILAELHRLPLLHREAIIRTQMESQSYKEVAMQLGKPIGTIQTWVTRGLARLRKRCA